MFGSTSLETPLLEKIRSKHEEIERLEQLVMKDLMREELSPMEQLSQGHRLRNMTRSIILKTEKLVKTYEEKKDEIAAPLVDETEIWTAFSNRLEEIHEYHGTHPSGPLVDADYEELLVDDAHDYGAPIEEEKPMKQAMGWDGKPIPYWLNKLGLGQEYKCEICRNHSYWGKKAFERHFQEWRHSWALGSFGILDRENKFNGITSIEEAKQVWKSQGGQCKDEKEIIKEKEKSNKAIEIPPPCIRGTIERVALALTKKGLEYESLNIAEHGEKDAKLSFLKRSDPYHAFYVHKLIEYEVSHSTPYSDYYGEDDTATDGLPDEYTNPPLSLETHKFTYELPEGITGKELDIIKLAAEFWARYGRCFSVGFLKRMVNDRYFEFMKKPTEGRCTLFGNFLTAYVEVLVTPPLEILKEDLRNNAADMETILENCYHRLQWDRFQWDLFENKAREERAKPPRRGRKPFNQQFKETKILKKSYLLNTR